jgi:ribosomal protein S17
MKSSKMVQPKVHLRASSKQANDISVKTTQYRKGSYYSQTLMNHSKKYKTGNPSSKLVSDTGSVEQTAPTSHTKKYEINRPTNEKGVKLAKFDLSSNANHSRTKTPVKSSSSKVSLIYPKIVRKID